MTVRIVAKCTDYFFRALTSMMSTLFFPLVPWLLQLILFTWFVGVLVYLVTSGSAQFKKVENGTLTEDVCSAAVSNSSRLDFSRIEKVRVGGRIESGVMRYFLAIYILAMQKLS